MTRKNCPRHPAITLTVLFCFALNSALAPLWVSKATARDDELHQHILVAGAPGALGKSEWDHPAFEIRGVFAKEMREEADGEFIIINPTQEADSPNRALGRHERRRGLAAHLFSEPTTQPTKADVFHDFRELWQSPRFC